MAFKPLVGLGVGAALISAGLSAQSAYADTYNVTVAPTSQVVTGSGGTTTVTVSGQNSPGSALPSQPVLANLLISATGTATDFSNVPFTLSVDVTDATTGIMAAAQNEVVTFGNGSNANGSGNSSFFTTPSFSGPLQFVFVNGGSTTYASIGSFSFVPPNASSGGSGSIGSSLTAGSVAPEPGSLALIVPGVLGMMGMVVRRRKTS